MDVPNGVEAPASARGKLRLNFRSWVEDYRRPEPPINREAVARAMHKRGIAKRKAAIRTANGIKLNGGRQDVMCARQHLAEMVADARRRADPIEHARQYLQRRGASVFRADVTGGRRDQWRVAGFRHPLTNDELLALAIRRGFNPSSERNDNA